MFFIDDFLHTLKEAVHVVLLAVLAVVVGALGWQGYQLTQKAEDLTVETQKRVILITQHTDRVLTELGLTAKEAREASKVTKEAAIEQKQLIAVTSDNIRKATEDFDSMILHTDASLNKDLLPQMSSTIAQANLELKREGDDLHLTLTTANERIADPAIAATLKNVNETTGHIAATTKDIRDTVHKAVQPRNKLLTLIQIVFGLGAKAGSIASGFAQ